MGIVWEAYHKGVPLLGVPGITLDKESGVKVNKQAFAPLKTNMTGWKIPPFSIGNTSTHSWWIFQSIIHVFFFGGAHTTRTLDRFPTIVVPVMATSSSYEGKT